MQKLLMMFKSLFDKETTSNLKASIIFSILMPLMLFIVSSFTPIHVVGEWSCVGGNNSRNYSVKPGSGLAYEDQIYELTYNKLSDLKLDLYYPIEDENLIVANMKGKNAKVIIKATNYLTGNDIKSCMLTGYNIDGQLIWTWPENNNADPNFENMEILSNPTCTEDGEYVFFTTYKENKERSFVLRCIATNSGEELTVDVNSKSFKNPCHSSILVIDNLLYLPKKTSIDCYFFYPMENKLKLNTNFFYFTSYDYEIENNFAVDNNNIIFWTKDNISGNIRLNLINARNGNRVSQFDFAKYKFYRVSTPSIYKGTVFFTANSYSNLKSYLGILDLNSKYDPLIHEFNSFAKKPNTPSICDDFLITNDGLNIFSCEIKDLAISERFIKTKNNLNCYKSKIGKLNLSSMVPITSTTTNRPSIDNKSIFENSIIIDNGAVVFFTPNSCLEVIRKDGKHIFCITKMEFKSLIGGIFSKNTTDFTLINYPPLILNNRIYLITKLYLLTLKPKDLFFKP